jgi:hypothetical protein
MSVLRHLLVSQDVCVSAVRTVFAVLGVAGVLVAISYPFSKRYFARALDEADRRSRILAFFGSILAAMGALHGWMFVYACSLGATCQGMFDLNCDGPRPLFYRALMIGGIVASIGFAMSRRWTKGTR